MRTTPAFTMPVVMLTASLSPFDEQERARLHPTRCLVKPGTVEEYRNLREVIQEVLSQHTSSIKGIHR